MHVLELTIARPSLYQISSLRKVAPLLEHSKHYKQSYLLTQSISYGELDRRGHLSTVYSLAARLDDTARYPSTHILAGNEFSSPYSLTSFSAHSSRIPGNGYALFPPWKNWIRKLKGDPLMMCSHAARFGGMMTIPLPYPLDYGTCRSCSSHVPLADVVQAHCFAIFRQK